MSAEDKSQPGVSSRTLRWWEPGSIENWSLASARPCFGMILTKNVTIFATGRVPIVVCVRFMFSSLSRPLATYCVA